MSDQGAEMTRRNCGSSPEAHASLPVNDDMLGEILLRLPPRPSSLPRVSAVCKRWRCLATDPKFLRRFYEHHRKLPLLGFFDRRNQKGIVFTPVLDAPDRIPPQRFDLQFHGRIDDNQHRSRAELLGCRHGRVLVIDLVQTEVVVCDPVAGEQHRMPVPPEFMVYHVNGTVICAAGDPGHVHGGCHSSPFKVILVSICRKSDLPFARVYSSQTGTWVSLISTEAPYDIYSDGCPSTLLGNSLYWLLSHIRNGILEFDLDRQSLAVTKGPPATPEYLTCQIIQAEDGDVGLATFNHPSFQMWQRKVSSQGVITWYLWKTVDMRSVLGIPPHIPRIGRRDSLLGYDEDTDVMFLFVDESVYMVRLKSMESRKLYESIFLNARYHHPFKSFYAVGAAVTGGCNGAEMLHNTGTTV